MREKTDFKPVHLAIQLLSGLQALVDHLLELVIQDSESVSQLRCPVELVNEIVQVKGVEEKKWKKQQQHPVTPILLFLSANAVRSQMSALHESC